MGLVMLGSKSDKALEEMLSYARETQHEKIIRSLSIGVAFVMYEQREGADAVIEEMVTDQVSPPSLMYGMKLTSRTQSSDMVACSLSPLLMLVPEATRLSSDYYTSPYPMLTTMFDERPLLPSDSFCSGTIPRSLELSSYSPRATTPMSDMVLLLLLVSRVLVPV
jgi:hypothetical protein